MNRAIRLLVHDLALHFHFDEEEAIRHLLETTCDKPKPKTKKEKKTQKPQEKKIPLPWLGNVDDTKCQALMLNYGLYTQCFRDPTPGTTFCAKCLESGKSHGIVQERSNPTFNGKNKKPVVMYGKVLKDRNILRTEAEQYARKRGLFIPEEHFELKKPKKSKEPIHDPNIELEEEIDDIFPDDVTHHYNSEDEYEEITCQKIEINGNTYLLDLCNNNVYGFGEENPFIGKFMEETQTIDFHASE